jgi:hypothetical protein
VLGRTDESLHLVLEGPLKQVLRDMRAVNQMIVLHVEDGIKIHVLVFVLPQPVLVVQLLVVAPMLCFVQL